ncbi:MAG: hypothetical protein LBJ35_04755 [Spirochaetaceae bacterium]|jgi:hypothetical protein|nr:hypothetical protein [Spirochaetaceae bacterium]
MDFLDTAFRSTGQWKAALVTLPDARFFNLMRGIFGAIQSPFNKHRLLDELAAFLSNKDTQETIAAYIGGDDHKIIAAVAALNEPARWDLGTFFSGEYSYIELDSLISNLEERFIVYTIKEDGRLSLNPLLKKILLPFAADKGILFSYIKERPVHTGFVYDDIFLASLLTLLSSEKHILKHDGSPRKNITQKAQRILHLEDADIFIKALRCIGLLPDGSFDPASQKSRDFAGLTEAERFAYCAAGVYISLSRDIAKTFPPQRKIIQYIASAAASLYYALDDDKCYTEPALKRIIQMNQAASVNMLYADELVKANILLEAVEKTGLLLKTADGYNKRIINSAGITSTDTPVIVFNSIFSFIILPEITLQEAMLLASFCEIVEVRPRIQFRVTRESAARGFNNGVSAKSMSGILKKLSSSSFSSAAACIDNDALAEALNDWEKHHSEIVVIEGVSLILSEEQRCMARAEAVAPHIVLNPSPGVYLLDFAGKDEAAAALRKAGAGMVFEPRAKSAEASQKKALPVFTSLTPRTNALTVAPAETPPTGASADDSRDRKSAEEYKRRFRAALDELKPSKMEREELYARIERKLVISTRQLSRALTCNEKREARGLDYAGKLALAKEALLSNTALEIVIQDSSGNEKCITGIPAALEKSKDETILSVKLSPTNEGAEIDDNNINDSGRIKISMGKIRLVRRMKQ